MQLHTSFLSCLRGGSCKTGLPSATRHDLRRVFTDIWISKVILQAMIVERPGSQD